MSGNACRLQRLLRVGAEPRRIDEEVRGRRAIVEVPEAEAAGVRTAAAAVEARTVAPEGAAAPNGAGRETAVHPDEAARPDDAGRPARAGLARGAGDAPGPFAAGWRLRRRRGREKCRLAVRANHLRAVGRPDDRVGQRLGVLIVRPRRKFRIDVVNATRSNASGTCNHPYNYSTASSLLHAATLHSVAEPTPAPTH